jgi:cytoskeletal protein CcmA (bactofilin family)
MALWKEQFRDDPPAEPYEPPSPASEPYAMAVGGRTKVEESVLAAGLIIEGKIEGSGNVRIAGTFKGDVQVQGDLSIAPGARVTGAVRANTVIIGGELQGNIEAAERVELLRTGILNGDLKAGSLTVAAGSRMRGRAEFGWETTQADD